MKRRVLAAGAVSVAAWFVLHAMVAEPLIEWTPAMHDAARSMQHATAVIAEYVAASHGIDYQADPNGTGLIGLATSQLVTTTGSLEAKRTTTSPDMAALLAHLLETAGVREGDIVAVGASGSFPALYIATLAAAEALGANVVVILSLGASNHGASNPEFNLLDIHSLLTRREIFPTAPVAVSLGGRDDVGGEFAPMLRQQLVAQVEKAGLPLIEDPELRKNVAERMAFYRAFASTAGLTDHRSPNSPADLMRPHEPRATEPGEEAAHGTVQPGGRPARVFVNIGGNTANLGTSPLVLDLQPGLNRRTELPGIGERGVLFEMAGGGVPIIHLLNIRGFAELHGVSWDPVPLPEPGASRLRRAGAPLTGRKLTLGILYIAGLALLFGIRRPGRWPQPA